MIRRLMEVSLGALVALAGCGVDESTSARSQGLEAMRCDPAAAPAGPMTRTHLVANELYDPFDILGTGGVGEIIPGETTCPGHEPTNNPLMPCPPGSRINNRGTTLVGLRLTETSGDPRLTGEATIVGNSSYDQNGEGQLWGTLHGTIDGGTWDGTWTGVRERLGSSLWVEHLNVVACGTGGVLQGVHARFDNVITSYTFVPIAFTGHVEADLLVPQS